ncbi:hypothetical protein WJX74_010323 [Apatococcus lobatus]|uniref:Uncharacterized protein n=1 Tax=Apatococcus lobatus TaxID=904363 RepID=A0AAW1QUK7_9CHLO
MSALIAARLNASYWAEQEGNPKPEGQNPPKATAPQTSAPKKPNVLQRLRALRQEAQHSAGSQSSRGQAAGSPADAEHASTIPSGSSRSVPRPASEQLHDSAAADLPAAQPSGVTSQAPKAITEQEMAAQRRRVRQVIPGLAVEADRPARSSGPSRFVPSLGLLLPAEAPAAADHGPASFGSQTEKPVPSTMEKVKRSAKQRIVLEREASEEPGTAHDNGAAELAAAAAADDPGDDLWDWDPVQDLGKQARAAKRKASTDMESSWLAAAQPEAPAEASEATDQPKKKRKPAAPRSGKQSALSSAAMGFEDSNAAAAAGLARPNLANAPLAGPDEPLALVSPAAGDAADMTCLDVPRTINKFLRDYQRQGVQFLFRQYATRSRKHPAGMGGILGDDMGLGKTVQTIAFCAALLGKKGSVSDANIASPSDSSRRHPILVVVPASVIDNWLREFSSWGLFMVLAMKSGTTFEAKAAMLRQAFEKSCEVVIVGIELFTQNIDDFLKVDWHVMIVDEAHRLKNRRGRFHAAACAIKTPLRYGLTGTAMQNDYDELWALMHWAVPFSLGEYEAFKHDYITPMRLGQQSTAAEHIHAKGRVAQQRLNILLDKYLLRRTKEGTLRDQLPRKTDNIVLCPMSELQLRAYRRALASVDFQMLVHAADPCDCGSELPQSTCCHVMAPEEGLLWPHFHLCACDNPMDPITNPDGCKWHKPEGCERPKCPLCLVLPCLSILQKLANHVDLIKANPQDRATDPLKCQREAEVAEMVLGDDLDEAGGCYQKATFLADHTCGKLKALKHLLQIWNQKQDKVLLFSYSVKMLSIVENVVVKKGYSFLRLDGSTPTANRQSLVDQFNHSPSTFLFLISTRAGGLGLNLTAANKVVIMDPSWNPAHDLQAQDRAYRIGQARDVTVYRLISTGTVEELIYDRQLYKQQHAAMAVSGTVQTRYFEGVKGDKSKPGELWGLHNLFKLTEEWVNTHDILAAAQDREANYDIRAFNAQDADAAETEAAAAAGTAAPELGVTDEGLGNAAQLIVKSLEGAFPGQTSLGAHKGKARAPAANVAAGPVDSMKMELDQLEAAGIHGIHQHEALMAGSCTERRLSARALASALQMQPMVQERMPAASASLTDDRMQPSDKVNPLFVQATPAAMTAADADTTDDEDTGTATVADDQDEAYPASHHARRSNHLVSDHADQGRAAACVMSASPLSFGDEPDPDDADQLCSPFLTGAELPVLTLVSPPDLTPDEPILPPLAGRARPSSSLRRNAQADESGSVIPQDCQEVTKYPGLSAGVAGAALPDTQVNEDRSWVDALPDHVRERYLTARAAHAPDANGPGVAAEVLGMTGSALIETGPKGKAVLKGKLAAGLPQRFKHDALGKAANKSPADLISPANTELAARARGHVHAHGIEAVPVVVQVRCSIGFKGNKSLSPDCPCGCPSSRMLLLLPGYGRKLSPRAVESFLDVQRRYLALCSVMHPQQKQPKRASHLTQLPEECIKVIGCAARIDVRWSLNIQQIKGQMR